MNHGASQPEELAAPAALPATGAGAADYALAAGAGPSIAGPEWRATGLEPAVFADPSGRRARRMGAVGLALVTVTLAALVIVGTAVVGFNRLPLPGPPPRAALAAASPHHAGRPVLIAGVRTEARHRGLLLRKLAAPHEVDGPGRVRD